MNARIDLAATKTDVQKDIDNLTAELGKTNTRIDTAKDEIKTDLKGDVDNLTNELAKTNTRIDTTNESLRNDIDATISEIKKNTDNLTAATQKVADDLQTSTEKSANMVETRFNELNTALGKQINDTYAEMSKEVNDTRARISTTTVSAGNNVTVEKTSSTDADGFAVNDYKVSLSDEVNVNKITADQGTIKNLQLGSDGDALSLTKNGNNISYTTPDGTNNTVLTDKNLKAGDGIAISQDGAGNTVISNTQQMDLEGVKANVRENAKEIRKVGAGAAALAGLHPVDFDPDYKFNMAVAGGGYRNEKALALGAFYRPNDNIMFSAATTVGNGENMYNVGASWKFGTSAKKVKDADLKSMQNQIDELRNMVNNLAQENHALRLANQRASFPDVPADHWANEAVEVLHGNNVLTGYPDGNFHGDRPMTRYEYAQMLYKTADKITQ